jgi:predicted Zn-dependent peptidase
MSGEVNRERIGEHIHFTSITDAKFKHNRLTVNFVMPLSRETASENAVIPFVLRKGTRELPDFTALNTRLEELYGATLSADVGKHGGYQLLEISIRGLADRFALGGDEVTRECAALLSSVALDPKLNTDGLFFEADVASERQYVIDTIESLINEKRGYALSQCLSLMCEGEPVAVRRYGYTELAAKITPRSATEAYRRILKTAAVEIIFTGCGDPAPAREIFTERFKGLMRSSFDYSPVRLRTEAETVREHTEKMPLSQAKLVLGMRAGEIENERQSRAARVFSALYGGTPFSKLFLNVRERLSLCYYCSSRFDASTRLLMVDSGVEAENRQRAQDEILSQLDAIRAGDFTEDELKDTKLLLTNGIRTVNDSLSAIEGWYLPRILRGELISPEEDIAALEEINREDVIEAAGKVSVDTVYFLTGDGDEDESEGAI